VTAAALGAVARTLFEALYPLREALQSPAAFGQLLRDLGHDTTVTADTLAGLDAAAFIDLVDRGEQLVDRLDELDGDDPDLGGVLVELVDLGQDLLAAVDDLQQVDGADLDPSLADPGLWQDLVQALPGHLLVQHLEAEVPLVYGLLRFCGVIADVDTGGGATREVFDADQLARVAADPVTAVRERYGWGRASGFQHQRLLDELALLLDSQGLEVRTGPVRDQFAERFLGTSPGPVTELVLPLLSGFTGTGYTDTGLALVPVPPAGGGAVSELFLTNIQVGGVLAAPAPAAGWSLRLPAGLAATGLAGLRLAPARSTLEDEPPGGSATWTLAGDPAEPWRLLGGLVELGGVDLEAAVSGPAADAELRLSIRTRDAAVALTPADGDSFLRHLVGSAPLRVPLSPHIEWSSRDGLTISGTAGLEVLLPLTLTLGPVLIESLHLLLTGAGATTRLQVDIGATTEIGPLVATVQGIGVALELSPAIGGAGSLGSLDLRVEFVAPHGIGFAIVSDIASGGGYVESDPDAGRYAGVLDIELLGVGLTAVGILSTQLPGGEDGWALFFSLTTAFTGLQLGFGFTLNGVGGLIGIHRGLDDVALGDGIRTGHLDSILFPEDPIANAATIISDIGAVFPVQDGQFVFGPVAKIGWGTPTILELDLGVVAELPDPVTFTLLGSLSAVLPDEDAAVLVLNVDLAGVFDLTAGTVAVDASLRDSQVAGISLTGDMAVRAELLQHPSFLLSFGGFNPHFDAPGSFPDLDRLSVALDTGDNLRIGMWGYFALSSNTVQFGAGADLWASAAGLTVEGHLNFDALIQFNPFLFIFQMGFGVDVRAGSVELFGVHLDLLVEGPNPFHVVGSASMKILGIKTSFTVDETIGSRQLAGPRETVYATTLLVQAIQDPGAWREVPPDGGAAAVILAGAADTGGPLRVHPAGGLEVVQRVVPLQRTLDHYGAAQLGDLDRFELREPALGGQPAGAVTDISDWFAPSQYYHLAEEERLSAPSFEQMPAGLRFDAAEVTAGRAAGFVLGYEQIVRDPDLADVDRPAGRTYTPTATALATALRQATQTRPRSGPLSTAGTAGSAYHLRPASWVVTDPHTGTVDPTLAGERMSWSQARTGLLAAADNGRVLTPAYETAVTA
jgi:hypothetical protein